ncbi:MAG: ATP synthase F1 subunit gamma [Clostridia bacterium]|nr:ATP synthase F1 subunit gamma [Clostridia bacterium]
MAGNMKAIKNRIKSVENTKQITKAMELVAASKLKKASAKIENSRPFFEILKETLDGIAKNNKDFSSQYCTLDESKGTCHIVIAGDRGLAGGYNNNLFKSVVLKENDVVFPIGRKAIEHFEHRGAKLFTKKYNVTEDVSISDCDAIGKEISKAYLDGKFGAVKVEYTKFVNFLSQSPASDDILPIIYRGYEKKETKSLIIYEPSYDAVFDFIVPQYIGGVVYGAVAESLASELSARRNAMQSANKNADEMINNLNLSYNRARQAAITQEITEIVAGSQE